jgi:diguanylate cyclase (GGDEF)-like protein/PAS domain S-box-containing protein
MTLAIFSELPLVLAGISILLGLLVLIYAMRIRHGTRLQMLELRRINQLLIEDKLTLQQLVLNTPVGMFQLDGNGNCIFANTACAKLVGLPPNASPLEWTRAIRTSDRERVHAARLRSMQMGQELELQYRCTLPAEKMIVIRERGTAMLDASSHATHYLGLIDDITAQKHEIWTLRQRNNLLNTIIEGVMDNIFIKDRHGRYLMVNSAFAHTLGKTPKEIIGKRARNIFPPDTVAQVEQMDRYTMSSKVTRTYEENVIINNTNRYLLTTLAPYIDFNGNVVGVIGSSRDITNQKHIENQLVYLAHHDSLTGLYNRAQLEERLQQAVASAKRHNQKLAVMFFDLDRFKLINDSFGHGIGDQLLQGVAERLKATLRVNDVLARLGGDEFVLLVTDIHHAEAAAQVAQKILDTITQAFVIDGYDITVTTSIGISLYPIDGEDSQTLLTSADSAMYRAKEQGKNTYQFYQAENHSKTLERLSLEGELRRALAQDEFVLCYQPQIDLKNGKITGVEALLRWQHPENGLLKPVNFIPLAEESGLIIPIGEWVLYSACAQTKAWHDAGVNCPRVAVNLSARQFHTPYLDKVIGNVLNQTHLEPFSLELEISESNVMHNVEHTVTTFDKLRNCGIQLCIEDFGTSHSSLSHLKTFQVHHLKIDQSFIQEVPENNSNNALTQALIVMAHSLELKVIAEGVETYEQLAFLREQNCDAVQGYIHGMPLFAEDILMLL